MNKLEITTLVDVCDLDIPRLEAVVQQLLSDNEVHLPISCVLTHDAHIRQLNKKYRNIDKTTDVLSFELSDAVHPGAHYCGEIYISVDRARQQAKARNRSLQAEITHLTVHGTLHLLGFEHDTLEGYAQMQNEEKKIPDLDRIAPCYKQSFPRKVGDGPRAVPL